MKDKILLTVREKTILLAIKSGFAFLWGFINTITVLQSTTFATMMTGNLLLLGLQTLSWEVEGIAITAVLIIAYILGATVYEALSILIRDEKKALLFSLASVLIMGILADVSQYVMQSCSDIEDETICKGKYLYYLAPVAFKSGMVAGGYLSAHPDSVITNLMTNHMLVCPKSLLKIYLTEGEGPKHSNLVEKSCTSIVLITVYFLGVVAGDSAEVLVSEQYAKGIFTPIFTCTAIFLATGCSLHFAFCILRKSPSFSFNRRHYGNFCFIIIIGLHQLFGSFVV